VREFKETWRCGVGGGFREIGSQVGMLEGLPSLLSLAMDGLYSAGCCFRRGAHSER
jgi:hypothetical protein